MRKLIDSAIIIALLTALLYAVSSAYRNGYLHGIGLSENILDLDFHHSVYLGFVLAFTGFMTLIETKVAIFLSVFAFLFLIFYFIYRKFHRLNKAIKKWIAVRNWTALITNSSNHGTFLDPTSKAVILVLFSSGLLLLLIHFEQMGRDRAKQELKSAMQHKSPQQENIRITLDGKSKELTLLTCGNRNCAGYDSQSNQIFYFPQQIMSFTPKPLK